MPGLPSSILAYLQALTLENRSPASLHVDKDGTLADWGGALTTYGLNDLRQGAPTSPQVLFLENLLPLQNSPLVLPAVETGEGCFADIHIFAEDGNHWVLLLDATLEEGLRRRFQQKVNELSLLSARQSQQLTQSSQRSITASLIVELFSALNVVPLERLGNGA